VGVGSDFSEGVFASARTDPDAVAFTPPGIVGLSAVGFDSPSGSGEAGDLTSSGITQERHPPPGLDGENDNFYQLERGVSTSLAKIEQPASVPLHRIDELRHFITIRRKAQPDFALSFSLRRIDYGSR
jgi:hypothetical protein